MCQSKIPFNLDLLRMGHFYLVRHDKGFIGNAIKKKQLTAGFIPEHAEFIHVGVLGGGQWGVNVAPPKTKIVDIRKVFKGRYIKVVKYKNEDYDRKGRYKVAFWSAAKCNLRYDWKGILAFVFKWIKQNNKLYFCSENAAASLQKEYPLALTGAKPSTVMPADFSRPSDFEIVWKGIIE